FVFTDKYSQFDFPLTGDEDWLRGAADFIKQRRQRCMLTLHVLFSAPRLLPGENAASRHERDARHVPVGGILDGSRTSAEFITNSVRTAAPVHVGLRK
ncbi:unnamed protein product, partial [Haemonchus placei]|uniref:Myotubularin phosphatase domain-containing protein n=1 Tax=Haemonchus placei TaxID=6290 RepID=A0A0N4WPR7_HAEPC